MLQHIIHKLFSIEKDEVASDAINPSRRTTLNADSFPMASRRTCESPIAAAEPQQASRTSSNLFCRHPWLLAWPCATNLGLSAARPPTLRVCARAVRATRSPRAHGSLPYGQPSAPVGLRIRAYSSPLRGLLPAACSARPTPPSGLMRGQRGRVVSVRHARPAAHTLRAVVWSAAATCSSAPVQSISQRGRQRLTAAATQQLPHATGNRLPAAPLAADARQRPPEAAPEPRQPRSQPCSPCLHQRASTSSWRPTSASTWQKANPSAYRPSVFVNGKADISLSRFSTLR